MTTVRRYLGVRLVAVATVVFGLSACSSVQLMYGFADDALESRAERYLDLDTAESERVRREIDALVAWHRAAMLPRYADFLEAQARVTEQGPWRAGDVARAFADFRGLLDQTAAGAAPYFARVLARHTAPEKIGYMKARMREYVDEELEEQTLDAEARLDERMDRRISNLERFVGTLRDDQVAIVRRHTEGTLGDRTRWLHHLGKRHVALADYLTEGPDATALAPFMHTLMLRGYDIVDPDYRAVSEARWAKLERLYAEVLASLDDGQRDYLAETLRGYARDIRDLAGGA